MSDEIIIPEDFNPAEYGDNYKPKMFKGSPNVILNKKLMLKTLEKHMGIVLTACQELGWSRTKHYHYFKTDPVYRQACKELDNIVLDFAESQLFKQIKKGNPLSTIFFLKCRGKKRGYIEQSDINIKGNMTFRADFGKSDTIQSTHESEENPRLD